MSQTSRTISGVGLRLVPLLLAALMLVTSSHTEVDGITTFTTYRTISFGTALAIVLGLMFGGAAIYVLLAWLTRSSQHRDEGQLEFAPRGATVGRVRSFPVAPHGMLASGVHMCPFCGSKPWHLKGGRLVCRECHADMNALEEDPTVLCEHCLKPLARSTTQVVRYCHYCGWPQSTGHGGAWQQEADSRPKQGVGA